MLEDYGVLTGRSSKQVLLYLLRRCYGLCYRLMASSEPVSEELMPIANVSLSLSPVRRLLLANTD